MTPDPCPLGRAWCTAGDRDDDRHICQSTDLELPSGWTVTLTDYHDGDGPELALNDPDCLLASALVGRLDIPAGCELVAALAAMIRDAQATATRTTTGAAP